MIYLPGGGTVLLLSRSGADITPAYPELAGLGAALSSRPAVLDGEVAALDGEGCSDFERLQSRMGLAGSPARAARMAKEIPAHLMLFDVPFLDAYDLTRSPYAERRTALELLSLAGAAWSTPAAVIGHGKQALDMTRTAGLEGLIAKRLTSLYEPGVRSRAWIEIRHVRTEDIVVGGWLPGHGRLTSLPGTLLTGQPGPDGRLHYVGSVGTGWSDTERTTLATPLDTMASDTCPFTERPAAAGARWVLPRLVGDVRYATRTKAGRLRHPSWHRLRLDLTPGHLS